MSLISVWYQEPDLMEISLRTKPKTYDRRGRVEAEMGAKRLRALIAGGMMAVGAAAATPTAAQEASKFGPEDLKLYCDGQERYLAIIREADEKFGIAGTDESVDWIRARQAENYAQIEKDLGASYLEWEPIARTEGWNHRCEALWRGWEMIEEADWKAATSDDAKKVEEALMLYYIKLTERGRFKNFDGRPYTNAVCESDVIDDFRLTGCRLFGGGFFAGFFSDPMIFMVANKDCHTAFVPLETHTKDDIQRSYYTDTEGNPVMTGWYVGDYPLPFDWVAAVERFGK